MINFALPVTTLSFEDPLAPAGLVSCPVSRVDVAGAEVELSVDV